MNTEIPRWLLAAPAWSPGGTAAWRGPGLLGIIWLSTAVWQVPMHRRLERGFDHAAHRRLVRSNRVRTIAWSMRGVLAVLMLATP